MTTVLKRRLFALTLLLALTQMFIGCFLGLFGEESFIKNYRTFRSMHIQFANQAEWTAALAFGFPYLALPNFLLVLTFILLQVGTWTNPLAYAVVVFTNAKNPMMHSINEGTEYMPFWSELSVNLLLVCAPTFLLSTILYFIGIARYFFAIRQDGEGTEGEKEKKKK